jgi:hypothetical protein
MRRNSLDCLRHHDKKESQADAQAANVKPLFLDVNIALIFMPISV